MVFNFLIKALRHDEGGNIIEILLLLFLFPCLAYSLKYLRKQDFLKDVFLFVGISCVSLTLLNQWVWVVEIVVAFVGFILKRLSEEDKKGSKDENKDKKEKENDLKGAKDVKNSNSHDRIVLNAYRAQMMIYTCISILAVDFNGKKLIDKSNNCVQID